MSQIENIFNVLTQSNRKWKIDGRNTEPTFDDVTRLVTQMQESLSNLEGNASIQCGGIMLIKDGNHIDVYVHLGELDEDSSNRAE